jgi:hypothetical protein
MAGFGKRGVPQQARRPVRAAKPAVPSPAAEDRPPPRVQSHGGLNWSAPVALRDLYAMDIPDEPGVFALMAGQRESDIVYIGGSKGLRAEFLTEIASQAKLAHPHAQFFSYARSLAPNEQVAKEIAVFRRRHGRIPRLNSGF